MKAADLHTRWFVLLLLLWVALAFAVHEFAPVRHSALYYVVLGISVSMGIIFLVRHFVVRFTEEKTDPVYNAPQSYTTSRKSNRAKKFRKDFLGNVAHELKTPIFNIQGYILTLLDGGMEDESINKLYLKRAERSTNRMINIVEDLDSIARMDSGEFKLNPEPFNLVKTMEEVFEYQEMHARKRGIKISLDGNYSKPIRVRADKKKIIEVIDNLIGNSIKYGKEGGRISIGFTDTGDLILVNITDDGIGIDEQDLPRIFERFYRVDKSRSRESGGTGLGLSIVKHTIQAHNQTITVKSRVDKGTTFIFSLERA